MVAAGGISAEGAGGAPGPVGLDKLLKLPSAGTPAPSRGGPVAAPDRETWEGRFRDARLELESAKARLAESQAQLERLAARSENWQVAAPGAQPGAGGEASPLSYKLRQEIRERREQVQAQEKQLRELEVEASLAGVPAEWRRPIHEDAGPES